MRQATRQKLEFLSLSGRKSSSNNYSVIFKERPLASQSINFKIINLNQKRREFVLLLSVFVLLLFDRMIRRACCLGSRAANPYGNQQRVSGFMLVPSHIFNRQIEKFLILRRVNMNLKLFFIPVAVTFPSRSSLLVLY